MYMSTELGLSIGHGINLVHLFLVNFAKINEIIVKPKATYDASDIGAESSIVYSLMVCSGKTNNTTIVTIRQSNVGRMPFRIKPAMLILKPLELSLRCSGIEAFFKSNTILV